MNRRVFQTETFIEQAPEIQGLGEKLEIGAEEKEARGKGGERGDYPKDGGLGRKQWKRLVA